MIRFFTDLLHNEMMIAAACGWVTAQVIKTILVLIIEKKLVLERLFGAGGMPSAHSATVCALATSAALAYGGNGPAFPLAFFLAFIVMYDARGVRRETGEQAKVINEMLMLWTKMGEDFKSRDPMDQLKELVGHTPLQVAVGALLGIAIAVLVHFLWFV